MGYGSNIERARRKAGLSQTKLAELINKDQGTISSWENDRFRPGLDEILALSEATGASLDELVRGAEPIPAIPYDESVVLDTFRALALDRLEAIRRLHSPATGLIPLAPDEENEAGGRDKAV